MGWKIRSTSGTWAEGGDSVYTISVGSTTYRVHEFKTVGSSSFVVMKAGQVEYLIIGGGGGGGGGSYNVGGGGGGAGGFLTGFTALSVGNYPISVGSGGITANSGTSSTFVGLTALGGGGAVIYDSGLSGASGGGAPGTNRSAGTGTSDQGFSGQNGFGFVTGSQCSAGGGGGAGGPGQKPIPNDATGNGAGGLGLVSNITGNNITYCTGGQGRSQFVFAPTDAAANTGNGGSGAGGNTNHPQGSTFYTAGAKGGSGIVIVRYTI